MAHFTYVELFVSDLDETVDFYRSVFGWNPQAWGDTEYLVESKGDDVGVDTGIGVAQDGVPKPVPVITVESVDDAATKVADHGGTVIVPKFPIQGTGYAAYFTDPAGLTIGLFEADETVS